MVACKTGIVAVRNQDGSQTQKITSGQLVTLRNNTLELTTIEEPTKIGSWQNGDFYFSRAPLEKVFLELEIQFDIEIEFESPQSASYTGYFSNKDLDKALTNVCAPLGLEYSIKDKERKIIIQQGAKGNDGP